MLPIDILSWLGLMAGMHNNHMWLEKDYFWRNHGDCVAILRFKLGCICE